MGVRTASQMKASVTAPPRHCERSKPIQFCAAGLLRRYDEALENSAAHLIELDALEQRFEIPFAETLVSLALDDLEEDRADHVLGEYLQQQALTLGRRAIHQDAALLKLGNALIMAFDALGEHFVIGVGRVLERNAAGADDVDRLVDI